MWMPPNRVEDAVLLLQVAPKDREWFIFQLPARPTKVKDKRWLLVKFLSFQRAHDCLPKQPSETNILLFQYGIIRWILPIYCLTDLSTAQKSFEKTSFSFSWVLWYPCASALYYFWMSHLSLFCRLLLLAST